VRHAWATLQLHFNCKKLSLTKKIMETHAHHLHKAPGKGFRHYFFEFFMLFLAVFCGLLAENWRESVFEKKREREYMQSKIEDLKTDTAKLGEEIQRGIVASSKEDTLIDLLNSENPTAYAFDIYRFVLARILYVQLEDRTSSQLKNAGGMRLIRNTNVANALRNYWNTGKVMDDITNRLEEYSSKIQTIGSQIINNKYFKLDNKTDGYSTNLGYTVDSSAKFFNNDPKLINQFSNTRYVRNVLRKDYIRVMKKEKGDAVELIKLIRERYHLNK